MTRLATILLLLAAAYLALYWLSERWTGQEKADEPPMFV